ncbi:Ig-like domain-containing protein [Hungatella hathewayi]
MAVKTVQAIINGVTTTLTLNSGTGKWEATITAPSTSSYNNNDGHYYPVTVKATDEAGNVTAKTDADATLGESLKLRVKEKVAPIITITYPTASALITNNKPEIAWKVTDADSGVNSGSIKITIDSGTAITAGITKTAITGGYQCTYTPTAALSDGSHTIKIDASDNDGNAATQKTVTFKVDTVPPTLSVTAPVAGLITNKAACTVTGTTNDITSSPVTVTIKLNSGSAEAVTVGADGSFSKSLTLASGNNTITIVATDSAGKSSTVTRTVTLDTTAPTIKSVTLTPNPVDAGKTYVISVEVTD